MKLNLINKPSDECAMTRCFGAFVRMMSFKSLFSDRQSTYQMVKVRSGRHEAALPLSLVRRIVEEASPNAFLPDKQAIRMDGGQLSDILKQMDLSDLPLRARRNVADAIKVGAAACALTFVGDVIIEADEETISLAAQKGASRGYAGANLVMSIATEAAAKSRRLLSSAG